MQDVVYCSQNHLPSVAKAGRNHFTSQVILSSTHPIKQQLQLGLAQEGPAKEELLEVLGTLTAADGSPLLFAEFSVSAGTEVDHRSVMS